MIRRTYCIHLPIGFAEKRLYWANNVVDHVQNPVNALRDLVDPVILLIYEFMVSMSRVLDCPLNKKTTKILVVFFNINKGINL